MVSNDLAGCRVLVVEDDDMIAQHMEAALADAHAEVVGPCATLIEALHCVQSGKPVDVAVLDIRLQGDLVFDLARVLREKGVPFMFASGSDAQSIPADFMTVARWEKPFDPEKLVEILPAIRCVPERSVGSLPIPA